MSDDPEGEGLPSGDADTLLYDYFKHLTSLSLLALGGMIALAERVSAAGDGRALVFAVVTVLLSAIVSFSGASQVVAVRRMGRALQREAEWSLRSAPLLLSIGVGAFLYLFVMGVVV